MAVFYNQATLTLNGSTINSNITQGELTESLSVTKTAVVPEYGTGDRVTYIISLVNSSDTQLSGLSVSDDLGAYEFGTQQVVPLTYTENSLRYYQDGVLQGTPKVAVEAQLLVEGVTVPANGSSMLVYEVTANDFASPEVGGEVTNTVTVSGGVLASAITAAETITALQEPELSIVKNLSPTTVTTGGELTYTFTVYNSSNTAVLAADNAVITDTFDPVLHGITVTLDGAVLPASSYTYDETTGEFATNAGVLSVDAAQFTQDSTTGQWSTVPAAAVLTVTGTV